jgi:hypothetical protein
MHAHVCANSALFKYLNLFFNDKIIKTTRFYPVCKNMHVLSINIFLTKKALQTWYKLNKVVQDENMLLTQIKMCNNISRQQSNGAKNNRGEKQLNLTHKPWRSI